MKTLPLSDVKARLSEVIEEIAQTQERVTVTRNGRPVVVLVSTDDLESIEETLDLLSDSEAMRSIAAGRAAVAAGEIIDGDAVMALRDRLRTSSE